ncbi:MAG: DNA polymerase III subunit delta [Candidatus Aquicultorales bacterium]
MSTQKAALKPAYLVVGEDMLVRQEIDKIKKVLGPEVLELSCDRFDASTASGAEIVAAASTPPFFCEHRLVLVSNIDKLAAAERKVVAAYLGNPSDTACLVMIGASPLGERNEILKATRAAGEVVNRELERGKIPPMVKKAFQNRGQAVGEGVVRLLVESAGDDLEKLKNEIEKVSLYCLNKKIVGEQDVRHVLSPSDETKIFEVTDRICARDIRGALKALDAIVQDGFERRYRGKDAKPGDYRMVSKAEHARSILTLLVNHFRALLRLKSLLQQGAGSEEIVEKLGLKGSARNFLIGKYRKQAAAFSLAGLRKAPSIFVGADLDLKSSRPPELVLERLIVELATL